VKLRDDGEQLVCIAELTFDMSVIDYTFMLLGKGTLHLLDSRVNSLALAKYVAEHGLTYVLSAPTTFALLCSYASWFDAKKLASLRTILVGGSAFHTKTADSLAALTPAATIYNLYGPTEVTVCCAGCVVQADDRKAAATIHIGDAFPGNLFLFDDGESIADSPRNEAELLIAGSQLMQGYVGQAASLETIQWQGQPLLVYRTGDIFEMRNGKLFFVTRKGGFIKSRGYRLSPHEIEDACLSHPAIAECAVVGMPDLTAENVLVLFYSTRSPLEVGDLTAHLQAKLASYSIPEAFVSLDELPKSSSGKVDYGALRTLAGARK
jgi:acyl-coenzyme A synthetase/AMP-(fatty) acid ligase